MMKKKSKKMKNEFDGLYGVIGKSIEANVAMGIYSAFSKSIKL